MNKFVVLTCFGENDENKREFNDVMFEVFKKKKDELTVLDINLVDPDIIDKFIEMGSFDCLAFSPENFNTENGKKLVSKVLKCDKLQYKNTQFLNVFNSQKKGNVEFSVSLGDMFLDESFNCNLNHMDISQDKRILCQNIIGMENSAIKTRQKLVRKENDVVDLIKRIVDTIEKDKDEYTAIHMRSVTSIARAISENLGLSEKEIEILKIGALIHDIGKQNISNDILNKKTRLTDEEYEIMKQHVTLGELELDQYYLGPYERAKLVADEHHERYDGTGYPRGLKGEEIDFLSRIVAISDATQAMFGRTYAPGKTKDEIINILHQNAGTQFDPKLVDVLVDIIENEPERLDISYNDKGQIIYDAPTVEEALTETSKDRLNIKEITFLDNMVKSEEEMDKSYLCAENKEQNKEEKSI